MSAVDLLRHGSRLFGLEERDVEAPLFPGGEDDGGVRELKHGIFAEAVGYDFSAAALLAEAALEQISPSSEALPHCLKRPMQQKRRRQMRRRKEDVYKLIAATFP